MKILALEFSSDHRGVAVVDSEAPRGSGRDAAEVETDGRSTHACAMMEAVLRQTDLSPRAVDRVAVGLGPGSYVGIRVAIALAEGWRLARGTGLIGVSSVECLAAQAHGAGITGRILIAVDAQRGEFSAAEYELTTNGWHESSPCRLAAPAEIEARRGTGVILVGPGLASRFPGARNLLPDAAMLARLAVGRAAIPMQQALEPIYLRPTSFVKAPLAPKP